MIYTNAHVRSEVEPMLKGKQNERIWVPKLIYQHMLGMSIAGPVSGLKYQVTRQKLRQVHSQFIARIVAQKLER